MARFERRINELRGDLSGFKGETRAEVGSLFGLVTLALLALGAIFAFLRKRRRSSPEIELNPRNDSATAEAVREIREAIKAHNDATTEELEHLKRSSRGMLESIDSSLARGTRERETLSHGAEMLKQQLESLDEKVRRLSTRCSTLEEANASLKAELVKIENIRMGLVATEMDPN